MPAKVAHSYRNAVAESGQLSIYVTRSVMSVLPVPGSETRSPHRTAEKPFFALLAGRQCLVLLPPLHILSCNEILVPADDSRPLGSQVPSPEHMRYAVNTHTPINCCSVLCNMMRFLVSTHPARPGRCPPSKSKASIRACAANSGVWANRIYRTVCQLGFRKAPFIDPNGWLLQ